MKNLILIALVTGASVAGVYAFDGYDADYSYNALQNARANKKAEQEYARQQHAELSKQVPCETKKLLGVISK